jgi:hypothetical protein
MYTPSHALSELDKFPSFKQRLIALLKYGQILSADPNNYECYAPILRGVKQLGAMIELRNQQEQP